MYSTTDDLRLATIAMGELLPATTRAFADVRDTAAQDGLVNMAGFYSAMTNFLAEARDHYQASLTNHMNEYLDEHISFVAE